MVATTTVNPPDMRFEPETTKRHDLLLEPVLRQDADALDGFCHQEHPRIRREAPAPLARRATAEPYRSGFRWRRRTFSRR